MTRNHRIVISLLLLQTAAAASALLIQQLGPGAPLGKLQVFPPDNPWNRDISKEPVDPDSDRIVARIGATKPLHPDFGPDSSSGIPYVVVSGAQAKVPVRFDYPDESDRDPYPIPNKAPIEGGPESRGDRHILIVDRDNRKLYELFSARLETDGWKAGSGAIFDLSSNTVRPAGWTSADAAGLPIFPGLVRADEVFDKKEISHALRFTVQRTRRAYTSPATHFASRLTDDDLPPMGMRVRLKSDFDISGYPPPARVILTELKKYGMIVADNGGDWFVSGAPDPRWDNEELATLKRVHGSDFEVVKMGPLVTR